MLLCFIILQSNLFFFIVENGEYLAKMTWNGKEQVLLLKPVSENSLFVNKRIQIREEDLAQAECFSTSKNVPQNNSIDFEKSNTVLDSTVLEEMLIEEVRKRPPIYDYTLPLSVRGRQKVADLWKEISEALNGNYLKVIMNNKILMYRVYFI